MIIDKDVAVHEIAKEISDICSYLKHNHLKDNESIFIANFPIEHTIPLAAALQSHYAIPIFTKADAVHGGMGVRIYPLNAVRIYRNLYDDMASEYVGFDVANTAFYWHDGKVLTIPKQEMPPSGAEFIGKTQGLIYMTDKLKHYQSDKPNPILAGDDVNVMTGKDNVRYWVRENGVIINSANNQEGCESVPLHVYAAYLIMVDKRSQKTTDLIEDL